jgi:CheY-like chemotaxis protein
MTYVKNDILLVNPNKEFLETMCAALRQSGYTVHGAMDMKAALTAITTQPVGLIICDNELQDVSGYEFLYYLKSDPLRDSIPFLFFVSLNNQGRAFKAFEMGAVDFLVYPMETAKFTTRIQEIMPSPAAGKA